MLHFYSDICRFSERLTENLVGMKIRMGLHLGNVSITLIIMTYFFLLDNRKV